MRLATAYVAVDFKLWNEARAVYELMNCLKVNIVGVELDVLEYDWLCEWYDTELCMIYFENLIKSVTPKIDTLNSYQNNNVTQIISRIKKYPVISMLTSDSPNGKFSKSITHVLLSDYTILKDSSVKALREIVDIELVKGWKCIRCYPEQMMVALIKVKK